MTSAQPYARADEAFFGNGAVLDAVVQLASANELTIYCGAGVTIDRTELGWGDLIHGLLLTLQGSDAANNLTPDEALLLRDKLNPLELASIYEQYTEQGMTPVKGRAKPVERHVPKLQEMLYKSAGWESGALVHNVCRLAAYLSLLNKTVRIVTTNYDVYLENAFKDRLRAFGISGGAPGDVPGLLTTSLGKQPHQAVKPHGKGGNVEIIYLHGRIPETGKLQGRLALSERDYHELHAEVVTQLESAFQKSSVLIVGSSLTDPPLLEALHRTHKAATTHPRIALVPSTSTRMSSESQDVYPRMIEHLSQRMKHYSATMLVPDFHFQVAQFCQEVLTCVNMGTSYASYAETKPAKSPDRYGERLVS